MEFTSLIWSRGPRSACLIVRGFCLILQKSAGTRLSVEPPGAIVDVLAYADGCGVGDEPLVTPVAGLSLKRCQAPTATEHAVHQPEFCLVLQGAKQVISGQDSLSFGRMESLIVSLDLPMLSWITVASLAKPYVALALAIDVALLQALAQKIGLARLLRTGCAAMTSSTPDPILDAMRRLFYLIKRPDAAPVLQPLILREIHNWLLTSSHGHLLRDLTHADCHAARIARAIALIRRDYASLLRISALAGVAGMSVSAFHGHFRQITGTTPL